MTKTRKTSSATGGKRDVMRIAAPGGVSKIQFGQVTVHGPKPSKAVVAKNVKRGADSLKRAVVAVTQAGVTLRPKKGVPQFFVDGHEPGIYRRRLDGRIDRGRLVNGEFVVID